MNSTDRMMAWAQIGISSLLLGFTGVIMLIYELGGAHFTPAQEATFLEDRKWLMGACMLVLYFWFQRLRQGGISDAAQTVTHTTTDPDGTVTRIVSPASNPVIPGAVSSPVAPLVPTPTQEKPK